MLNLSAYQVSNLLEATYQTAYMTIVSTAFVGLFGFMVGVILFVTKIGNSQLSKIIYHLTSFVVNVLRSIPFIILIILLIPFAKLVTGTMLGPNAALPALVIGLSPFYARMVETSLHSVDKGILELSTALGANTKSTILKFLLPESLPNLIANLTTVSVSMIGFSAVAGIIGAGGLGNLAYLEGFENQNYLIIYLSVIIILLMTLVLQGSGNLAVKLIKK